MLAATQGMANLTEKQLKPAMEEFTDIIRQANVNLKFAAGKGQDVAPIQNRAAGGMIYGSGGPKSDSIPAMLSHGEFVVNAASTAANRGLLEQINSGVLPGFADGGVASAKYLKSLNPYSRRAIAIKEYNKNLGFTDEQINPWFRDATKYETLMYNRSQNYEKTMSSRRDAFAKAHPGIANRKYAAGGMANGGSAGGGDGGFDGFASAVTKLQSIANTLNNLKIPEKISMEGNHKVEVIINGASILQDLLGGPLGQFVQVEVQKAIGKHINPTDGSTKEGVVTSPSSIINKE